MDGGRRDPQARAAATVCSHGPWRGMVPPPQVESSEIILKAINMSWGAIALHFLAFLLHFHFHLPSLPRVFTSRPFTS